MLPLIHYQGFGRGVILSPPGVRLWGENIDICFTFEGEVAGTRISRPHKNNKTSHQFASQPRFKPLQWAKLEELRNLRSFLQKLWFILSPKIPFSEMNYQSEVNFFGCKSFGVTWTCDVASSTWTAPPLISWVANFSPPITLLFPATAYNYHYPSTKKKEKKKKQPNITFPKKKATEYHYPSQKKEKKTQVLHTIPQLAQNSLSISKTECIFSSSLNL